MVFKDDDPIDCEFCDETIRPGEFYKVWRGHKCCCDDCVRVAMFEELRGEIEDVLLPDAAENEARYADSLGVY